jgi:hypothetical protein
MKMRRQEGSELRNERENVEGKNEGSINTGIENERKERGGKYGQRKEVKGRIKEERK